MMRSYWLPATAILVTLAAEPVFGQPSAGAPNRCGSTNTDESIAACTRIIDFDVIDKDALAIARYHRGNAYAAQRRYDRAIEDYTSAIELHPAFPGAFNNRANARAATGAHVEAISDYTKALALDPTHAWALFNRASSFLTLGRFQEAIGDLSRAIELRPDSTIFVYQRGLAYEGADDFVHAREDYERVLILNPDNIDAKWALTRLQRNH
jgi:tetratricopeptide (TPR) repeat protein